MSGCSTPKFYPLCIYDTPPGITTNEQVHKNIKEFVGAVTTRKSDVAISSNNRVVAINAYVWEHSKLEKIWPRYACIGTSGYDEKYSNYKECVRLLQDAIDHHRLTELGGASDGLGSDVLYCGGVRE
jgi:hypothetical protein